MNKIKKKLKILGYKTSTIKKPRNNHSLNEIQDIQLSLNLEEMQFTEKDQKKFLPVKDDNQKN